MSEPEVIENGRAAANQDTSGKAALIHVFLLSSCDVQDSDTTIELTICKHAPMSE